ncbi:translation initiation factor IF-2-like [Apus apus]|uniref:translation initiation factor IF-2-like n=1 Tax=Apus apus TaxID=8895 RepID=UPI0021F820DC|nr:translation initiation factor IF-2-like [Apus apus]
MWGTFLLAGTSPRGGRPSCPHRQVQEPPPEGGPAPPPGSAAQPRAGHSQPTTQSCGEDTCPPVRDKAPLLRLLRAQRRLPARGSAVLKQGNREVRRGPSHHAAVSQLTVTSLPPPPRSRGRGRLQRQPPHHAIQPHRARRRTLHKHAVPRGRAPAPRPPGGDRPSAALPAPPAAWPGREAAASPPPTPAPRGCGGGGAERTGTGGASGGSCRRQPSGDARGRPHRPDPPPAAREAQPHPRPV